MKGDLALKKSKFTVIRSLLISFLAFLVLSFNFSFAADPKRVALLPFKINAEKDLSFLRDGIFDMLTSRLSKEGQVEVLSRAQVDEALQSAAKNETVNEATARSIGSGLNADFVLFGSLTVLGENVSIDAKMVDVSGSKPTMTFFDQSQDLGAVISKINLIAADINDKMFGRTTVVKKAPPVQSQPQSKKTAVHAHPEKVLEEDGFIESDKPDEAGGLAMIPGEARESQQKFWKSANFKHLIYGVSLGDVDGDGKIETVSITPHSVIIYRSERGRFFKLHETSAGSKNLIGVDVADINDNGYAEIFVTSLNAQRKIVNSFVLEYNGNNFTTIVDNTPWYYRVADTPGRGKILLGQRPRVGKPFSGKIHEMTWQNPVYVPGDQIKAPKDTHLLGFTIGDVLNNDRETAIAYKPNDHIQVIDPAGKSVWDGSDRLGGSMIFYSSPWDDIGQVENRTYFPMRLAVWKNRAKKETEVIAVKNYEYAVTGKLEYRQYKKTQIQAFTWDGVGLAPNWKTRQLSGYIPDFSIGDFDNDGRDELLGALILKEGRVAFFTEPKSTMIAYELGSADKKEP